MAKLYLTCLKLIKESRNEVLSLLTTAPSSWEGKKTPKILKTSGIIEPKPAEDLRIYVAVGPATSSHAALIDKRQLDKDKGKLTEVYLSADDRWILGMVSSPFIDDLAHQANLKENRGEMIIARIKDEDSARSLVERINKRLRKQPLLVTLGRPYLEKNPQAVREAISVFHVPMMAERKQVDTTKAGKRPVIYLKSVRSLISILAYLNLYYINPSRILLQKIKAEAVSTHSFFMKFPQLVSLFKTSIIGAAKGEEKWDEEISELGTKLQALKPELRRIKLADEDSDDEDEVKASDYWDLMETLAFMLANPEHAHTVWYTAGSMLAQLGFADEAKLWRVHS